MSKIKISSLLPVIGLILFVYIITKTGIGNILKNLSEINPIYFLFLLPLIFIMLLLKGLKWKLVLGSLNIKYPLIKCCKIWSIGYFAGILTPGKIGDAIRAFYVKKDTKKKIGECFSTIFIDRIFDLAVILILAVISIFILSSIFAVKINIFSILFAIFFVLVFIFVITKKKIMGFLLKPIFDLMVPKKYKEDIRLNFNSFYNTFVLLKKKKMLGILFLTVVTWFFSFTYSYYISLLLGLDVKILYIFLIMPIITVVEIIPISISGLGTREAAMIFLFSLIGINAGSAVLYSLTYLMLSVWLNAAIGLGFWLKNPIQIK